MKLFRKIKVTDREVSQVQDNVAQILVPLSKNPLIDGSLITVQLTSGANKISHGLSRIPLGWIIVDRNNASTVYRTAWDSTILNLTASGSVTLKLWIF